MSGKGRVLVFLAIGYALTLSIFVGAALYARDQALRNFESPEAREQWNAWSEAARQQSQQGPIQRRLPKSHEAPSLVLLRDHFAVVIAAAVVFGSALYAIFAFLWYGLWLKPRLAKHLEE
jgi:hypothetical protein